MITFSACGREASVICDQCGTTRRVLAFRMLFAQMPERWFVAGASITCGVICSLLLADRLDGRSAR